MCVLGEGYVEGVLLCSSNYVIMCDSEEEELWNILKRNVKMLISN